MHRTIRPALSVAVALLSAAFAFAAPLKSDSVVKATAVAAKPDADGKQTVTLTLAIDPGWHLYANPVGNDDLVSVQTVVKPKAAADLQDVSIDYPHGKTVKDATLGDYKVYEGKAVITLHVTRTKGDDSPLDLTIKVQACNDSKCLLPAEMKVTAAP